MSEKNDFIHGVILILNLIENKLSKCLWSWNLNFALFNDFQKVWRAQAWPGWGIWIIKNAGWKHMICQKWRHEFWWHCLGDYYAYQHKVEAFWPVRNIIKYLLYLYLSTFTFNLKLAIQYEGYQKICIDIAKVVGTLMLGNLITLSILFVSLWWGCYESFRYPYNDRERRCKHIATFLIWLYPWVWAAGMVWIYIYWPFARLMAWYLLWQWVAIISISIIITVTIWILMYIQNKIQVRRYQRQYEM